MTLPTGAGPTAAPPPVIWHPAPVCQVHKVLKADKQLVCNAAGKDRSSSAIGERQGAPSPKLQSAGRLPARAASRFPAAAAQRKRCPAEKHEFQGNWLQCHLQQAQPLASSMVSARSAVVAGPWPSRGPAAPRISLASMFTEATSFTMHPILRSLFCST